MCILIIGITDILQFERASLGFSVTETDMSDLAEELLQYLGEKGTVDSLHLSNELQQDHQKIVGAIKSVQVRR